MIALLRRLLSVLLCASAVALATAAQADGSWQTDPVAVRTKALLEARDYAGLAQAESEYLRTKARTSAGGWKLALYYSTIQEWLAHRGRAPCSVEARKFVDAWTRATPQSPAATIVNGTHMVDEAFCIRGEKLASQVDPRAWGPFFAQLERARRYLEAHKASAQTDPQWFVEMESVANAQDWDRPRFMALLKAAQAREPLYHEIYYRAAMYFQPQWHGSLEELDRLARYAVMSTERWEGSGLYARVYWYAHACNCDVPFQASTRIDWALMKTSMEDVAQRYPDPWNINNFALFACTEGDWRETKYFMEKIRGPLLSPPWRNAAHFASCRDLAMTPRPPGS